MLKSGMLSSQDEHENEVSINLSDEDFEAEEMRIA